MQRLLDWLATEHGMQNSRVEPSISTATPLEGGNGLVATGTITKGGTACTIPASALLTPMVVAASEMGSACDRFDAAAAARREPPLSRPFVAILHLAQARADAGHPFHPYAASLPEVAPTVQCWPQDLRRVLAGTNLGHSSDAARKAIEDAYARITNDNMRSSSSSSSSSITIVRGAPPIVDPEAPADPSGAARPRRREPAAHPLGAEHVRLASLPAVPRRI